MRLKRTLLSLCDLYNLLRAKKIEEYKQNGVSLTKTNLRALALAGRGHDSKLRLVHSQVVQNVADRVHIAFEAFLGGRARFPKNKQPRKYLSLTYPQSGFRVDSERGLYLSGIGCVRIFMHRSLLGKVERLTVKREADEWYAIFLTERKTPPKQPISTIPLELVSGADLGLEKFAVLDNGKSFDYPEYLRRSEEKLKQFQRRLGRKKRGSKRWSQLCLSLAKLHLHIKRQRADWQNKRVKEIFSVNEVLVLEKLNIRGMLGTIGLPNRFQMPPGANSSRRPSSKPKCSGSISSQSIHGEQHNSAIAVLHGYPRTFQ